MGCKMIAAITWTQLELKELIEDEESHVHLERVKKHLGLHPFHLTDLNAALREILTSSVNSYDPKLQGIILSYRNPKLLSRMGTVIYDACYIHVDIEADFYIFRPNVGDNLKGIVNKKSQNHVGILVHKTFNAVIPRPDDNENWPGHSIRIGQEVRFTVTCLDFKNRLPYIRGSLDEQDYSRGCKIFDESLAAANIANVKPTKTKFSYDEDGDLNKSNSDDETNVDDNIEEEIPRRKSKKSKVKDNEDGVRVKNKKKHKVEVEVLAPDNEFGPSESSQNCEVNDDHNEEEFSVKKLKLKKEIIDDDIPAKKKKKKRKVKDEDILPEAESDAHESIKRRAQKVSVSEDELLPSSSKKWKREIIEERNSSKNNTEQVLEVEILYSDVDSAHGTNGNSESRKKQKIKMEVLSSETESDVNQPKQRKRTKIESDEALGSRKKHKVKAEVLPSDSESSLKKTKQSKKKHKIKTEVVSP